AVAILLRLPRTFERADELQGQIDLATVEAGIRGQVEPARRRDLVREAHRRQRHRVARRLHRRDVLTLTQTDSGSANAPAPTQRLAQQRVRLGAGLLRLEVVRLLEVDRW